jgi:hypothetical protein
VSGDYPWVVLLWPGFLLFFGIVLVVFLLTIPARLVSPDTDFDG